MPYVHHRLGPLNCTLKTGDTNNQAVVLLHGYGANKEDLAPFGQILHVKPEPLWVFPDAPLEIATVPGFFGRAWFPIDMRELEEAMQSGRYREFRNLTPPGLDHAAAMTEEMLTALNIPIENVVLGGFSQGAMLATELALTLPKPPRALCILSGTQLNRSRWENLAQARPGMRFFQSHGRYDQLLDPEQGHELYECLTAAGWVGEFISFDGGHEIPDLVVKKLNYFLSEVFTTNS